MPPSDEPLEVYYNSACPVCAAGIEAQQQRMQGCAVRWIDVHAQPQSVQALGAELEAVRERLHVRDASGRVHVGADALAAVWSHTPQQGWLARATRAMHPLSHRLYNGFARLLYRWNRRRGHWS